jgi:hypothetical protein
VNHGVNNSAEDLMRLPEFINEHLALIRTTFLPAS